MKTHIVRYCEQTWLPRTRPVHACQYSCEMLWKELLQWKEKERRKHPTADFLAALLCDERAKQNFPNNAYWNKYIFNNNNYNHSHMTQLPRYCRILTNSNNFNAIVFECLLDSICCNRPFRVEDPQIIWHIYCYCCRTALEAAGSHWRTSSGDWCARIWDVELCGWNTDGLQDLKILLRRPDFIKNDNNQFK